jgi:hypothetical protein
MADILYAIWGAGARISQRNERATGRILDGIVGALIAAGPREEAPADNTITD